MGLYPCFEFLSAKTSCLWGISVLELVKSLSAGNRNILSPMIVLKIFAPLNNHLSQHESRLHFSTIFLNFGEITLDVVGLRLSR